MNNNIPVCTCAYSTCGFPLIINPAVVYSRQLHGKHGSQILKDHVAVSLLHVALHFHSCMEMKQNS